MAVADPLIRSSLLSEFPALVLELGGSLDEILDTAGLSLEQVEASTLLIPLAKEVRLLQVAAQHCQREDFGLELARRQDMAIFGALSVLAMNCPTVRSGLQMFGRYLHYSVQAVETRIKVEGELAYFSVDTPFEVAAGSDQFWDHSVLLSLELLKVLCGQDWKPRSVFLRRTEPADFVPYSKYFSCPVLFDSEVTQLVFDASLLERPVSGSISAIPGQLQAYLRQSFQGDFLEQVRRVIVSLLPTEQCDAGTVAQCMGYSLRTLQRKLRTEQTGFQQQLDRVRSQLAISYLQEAQFSLTDIGGLLGFAELAVFSRTFKRWFGVTPSQWRSARFS